jgi:glycosyltransferase involved in cell wall biosynthesis
MKELVKPYLLYIGNAYPHKNLERLIFAFKKLVKDGLDYQLVLVGGNDYFYEKLKLEIRNLELEI